MKRVVSFSLWGNNPTYTLGAVKNAQQARALYPGFEFWFYVHTETVPSEIINQLTLLPHVKLIFKTGDLKTCKPMMWRFEAIDDPEVEIMLSRDTDTRILLREILAVDAWLKSDKLFHIMRDHPDHNFEILGGMFGTKKLPSLPNWQEVMDQIIQQKDGDKGCDQEFLKRYIYPVIKNQALIHASFHLYEPDAVAFPIPYDADYKFVGEYVYADESRSSSHIATLKTGLACKTVEQVHWITSFYVLPEKDAQAVQRNEELYTCLYHNLQNPHIAKIHLYVDDLKALNKALTLPQANKIVVIGLGKQPLYADLFNYAIAHLAAATCVIANSDIYLYKCDLEVLRQLGNTIFALSRHEADLTCAVFGFGSHDAFMFNSQYLTPAITEHMQHVQNVAGSDDNIVNILVEQGYTLLNPCFEIMLVHLHQSNLRTYTAKKIVEGRHFIKQDYFVKNNTLDTAYASDADFTFYPGVDHNGDDLYVDRGASVALLKVQCKKDGACDGFNTLGFFKKNITVATLQETTWIHKQTAHGIFVKKHKDIHFN